MATLLESITGLLVDSLANDPPLPARLQGLGDSLAALQSFSADATGAGIDRWLRKLSEITGNSTLHETLVVRVVQMKLPRLAESLTLLGVFGIQYNAEIKPDHFTIDWAGLDDLLSKPGEASWNLLLSKVNKMEDLKALQALALLLVSAPKDLVKLEYDRQGFAALPLEGDPVFTLQDLIGLVQSPLKLPLPIPLPLTLDQFMDLAGPAAAGVHGSVEIDGQFMFGELAALGLDLHLLQTDQFVSTRFNLGNDWQLDFGSRESGEQHYRLQATSGGFDEAVRPTGELEIFLTRQTADVQKTLIGDPQGTHLSIQSMRFGLQFKPGVPLFELLMRMEQIEFALKPDFLKFISFGLNLPTLLRFKTSLEVGYLQGKGFTGQGGGGFRAQFATPLNLSIGGAGAGIRLDQVLTELEFRLANKQLQFQVKFRYGANGQFGPLTIQMDGAGAWLGRGPQGTGGLLPPQGIGLSLKAGPVSGGGFLKFINDNEFAGALQLKILGIGAFAYGVYKTLPGGEPSFVVLIGIRLPLPGVQLGFGFAVSGFGGLVGINRRADTDLLRERLASGASGDVLFNDDPLKNAPRLLGDMAMFFPDEKAIFLIGPTLQINWLMILKLDVGLFIELPGPRKVFIAGSARLVIGDEAFALVYLRMDFIGGIDFTKSLVFFDAMLVNSHVLGIFRITGGVALRLAFGSNGYFLFTVGGFHPSFNPGAMELPRVARVGVSVSLGLVWMKQEMYLAITSNTFQLGMRVEAGLEIGPISAHGWFGFDALIQFEPFHFVARIDAGFEVEVEGVSLCSVRVEGQLSGPGPLVLQARASVRLLFIKVSGDVTIELSSNPPPPVISIPNLPLHLKAELSKPENLRVEGEDRSVVFAPGGGVDNRFAPVGDLIWEQKRAPLHLAIEKVEGVELGGWHTLEIEAEALQYDPEEDWFGVGTYLKLGDSEALNNTRFSPQQSGLRVKTGQVDLGHTALAEIKISLVKLPKRFKFPILFTVFPYSSLALAGVMSERHNGATLEAGQPKVAVRQEAWNAHGVDGQALNAQPLNSVQAFVQVKQAGGIALPATEKALDLAGVI